MLASTAAGGSLTFRTRGRRRQEQALRRRRGGSTATASAQPSGQRRGKEPQLGVRRQEAGDRGRQPQLFAAQRRIKELSGDDPSFVNAKYAQPFTITFQCRAMVFSNYEPAILGDQHNTSRTLWIGLDPLMLSDAERRTTASGAWRSWHSAWRSDCHERRCLNDYAIQVNDRAATATGRGSRIAWPIAAV
jgi:hypothetical protein